MEYDNELILKNHKKILSTNEDNLKPDFFKKVIAIFEEDCLDEEKIKKIKASYKNEIKYNKSYSQIINKLFDNINGNKKTKKYRYFDKLSIIFGLKDEYMLDKNELVNLFAFYVLYAVDVKLQFKSLTFSHYTGIHEKENLTKAKQKFLNYNSIGVKIKFVEFHQLKETMKEYDLVADTIDYDTQRAVGVRKANNFEDFFRSLRNCIAHGRFVLKYNSSKKVKMIVLEDRDDNNFTFRMIVKLDTLFKIIEMVDKNNILSQSFVDNEVKKDIYI